MSPPKQDDVPASEPPRRRVLMLYTWSAFPPVTGGQHAVFGLARALSAYCDCTLAHVDERATDITSTPMQAGLTLTALPAADCKHDALGRLMAPGLLFDNSSPIKKALRHARSAMLKTAIEQLARRHDAIVFCSPWMWPTCRSLASVRHRPIFYDSQNVETHIARSQAASRTRAALYGRVTQGIEAALCAASDQVWCCTPEDAAALAAFANHQARTDVGFKGRDACAQPPVAVQARDHSAIFVGSAWGPNCEAANYICTQLAPALPQYRFHLAGACCERVGQVPPNVVLLGHVDDLDAEIMRHRVALNPITSGSGINMKLFDYMATGTPIVSTPFGARGLPDDVKTHIKQAQLPQFAAAVEQVIRDEALWQQRSQGLVQGFHAHFRWDAIGAKAHRIMEAAIQQRAARPVSRG